MANNPKNEYTYWRCKGRTDVQALVAHPQRISSAAKMVFSYGNCHSLALAIHTITGWPIVGLYRASGALPHVVVQSPKGYLDIEGLDAKKKLEEEYSAGNLKPVYLSAKELTAEQVRCLKRYLPADPEIAMPFAKLLVEKWFGKIEGQSEFSFMAQ